MQIARWNGQADTLSEDITRGWIQPWAQPHFEIAMLTSGTAASPRGISFYWSHDPLARRDGFVTPLKGVNRRARSVPPVSIRTNDDFPRLWRVSESPLVLNHPFQIARLSSAPSDPIDSRIKWTPEIISECQGMGRRKGDSAY